MNTSKGQGKVLKTRKAIVMKKATLTSIVSYFSANAVPAELTDALEDLRAEYAKSEEKARVNRELYAEARDVVKDYLSDTPQTVNELFAACEAELPDTFSKSKLQYALRDMWSDIVVKHDNGKNPYTYTKA